MSSELLDVYGLSVSSNIWYCTLHTLGANTCNIAIINATDDKVGWLPSEL